MISCIAPGWLYTILDWVTESDLIIVINWLLDHTIIICNEVI